MAEHINLVKLCVGAEQVADLLAWQDSRAAQTPNGRVRHVTRMWPKRADALLAGGSLYWVFKGLILCRQRILALDEVTGADGIARCGIVLDRTAIRVRPMPRKPFQGWRYLAPSDAPSDAPADLPQGRDGSDILPPRLESALAEIGVL